MPSGCASNLSCCAVSLKLVHATHGGAGMFECLLNVLKLHWVMTGGFRFPGPPFRCFFQHDASVSKHMWRCAGRGSPKQWKETRKAETRPNEKRQEKQGNDRSNPPDYDMEDQGEQSAPEDDEIPEASDAGMTEHSEGAEGGREHQRAR